MAELVVLEGEGGVYAETISTKATSVFSKDRAAAAEMFLSLKRNQLTDELKVKLLFLMFDPDDKVWKTARKVCDDPDNLYKSLSEKGKNILDAEIEEYVKSKSESLERAAAKVLTLVLARLDQKKFEEKQHMLIYLAKNGSDKVREEIACRVDFIRMLSTKMGVSKREKFSKLYQMFAKLMEDKTVGVRRSIATGMYFMGPKDLTDELKVGLILLMCDEDENVRKAAKKAAERLGYQSVKGVYNDLTEDGKALLSKKIEDYAEKEYAYQWVAVRAIKELGLDLPEVLSKFANYGNEVLRTRAIDAMRAVGAEKFSKDLFTCGSDRDKRVREAVATAISSIKKEALTGELKVRLILLMCDEDENVEKAAKKAAERLGYGYYSTEKVYDDLNEAEKTLLFEEIKDYAEKKHAECRIAAVNAIKELGLDLPEVLAKLASDKDKRVRERVATAISSIKKEQLSSELKVKLLLLMCDTSGLVSFAAKKAAENLDYRSKKEVCKDLDRKGKELLFEEIRKHKDSDIVDFNKLSALLVAASQDNERKSTTIGGGAFKRVAQSIKTAVSRQFRRRRV